MSLRTGSTDGDCRHFGNAIRRRSDLWHFEGVQAVRSVLRIQKGGRPSRKGETAMILLKKILVATDFSEPSDNALAYGQDLARTFGAKLVVLHVVDNIAGRAYGPEGFILTEPHLQDDLEAGAFTQLDTVVSAEDRDMLKAETIVLTSNAPAAAITTYAQQSNVDLIVMGTHGRGAVAHLLMGSVAERVVRTAPCPVLTVRRPEHEFVLPDALVAVAKA